jgi:hypothetical protein
MVISAVAIVALYTYDGGPADKNDAPPRDGVVLVQGTQGTHFGLNGITETKIKQDYLDAFTEKRVPGSTIDDVFVENYYGIYTDCIVVRMTDRFTSYTTAITYETIDGVTISYSSSNKAVAWKDGVFYDLQNAYDEGLLTKDDLIRVASIWPSFWGEEKQIRQGYVATFVDRPYAAADRVWIERYYGGYHECKVLMMWYGNTGTGTEKERFYVDGILFVETHVEKIIAWKDGRFYELRDAYDRGLLTKEDIAQIAEYHKAAYPHLYES